MALTRIVVLPSRQPITRQKSLGWLFAGYQIPWRRPAVLPEDSPADLALAPSGRSASLVGVIATATEFLPWRRDDAAAFEETDYSWFRGRGTGTGNPDSPGSVPWLPPVVTPLGDARRFSVKIPRTPYADNRTRSHTDRVASLLNSLLRLGYIRLLPDGEYKIVSGAYVRSGPPLVTDDTTVGVLPGNIYVDSDTNEVYINASSTTNSSVWVGPL